MADLSPPAVPAFRLGHRRWLEGLRGVAILLVVIGHAHVLEGGFLGLDVFFVLSGFLITTLLIEEWERTGTVRFGRFYLRRSLRLFPALALTSLAAFLAVAALLVSLLTHPLPGLKRLLDFGPLVWTGRISYGLYLSHNLVIAFVLPADREHYVPPGQLALILGLSFAAALLSYFLVERPFLRLKERIGRPAPREEQPAPADSFPRAA